jgi:hypothetical protein
VHFTVKIHAILARADHVEWNAPGAQQVRFIADVAVEGVRLARDQVVDPVAGHLQVQLVQRNPFIQEHRQQFRVFRRRQHHQPLAHQVGGAGQVARGDPHAGRRLQDRGQRHHGFAFDIRLRQAGIGDAEIRFPFQDPRNGGRDIVAGDEFHIQARFAVITLLYCGVIAGELELVRPAQLHAHVVERRPGHGAGATRQQQGKREAA